MGLKSMKLLKIMIVFAVLIAGLLPTPFEVAMADSPAHVEDPTEGGRVAFNQKLNEQIPLDAAFVDENGRAVRLGDYLGKRPAVLVFAYYDCPMLCTIALKDLAQNMNGVAFVPGKEFEVIAVSINPDNTSDLATQKKNEVFQEYEKPEGEVGWHFLVGQQAEIDRVTAAAGFKYYYDPKIKEYAHPTGILILTPEGKISRYLLGIDYAPLELRMGLVEASARKIGKPVVDAFYLLCYNYDPQTGRYTLAIQNFLRFAAVIFIAGLGLLLYALIRSDLKGNPKVKPGEPQMRSDLRG